VRLAGKIFGNCCDGGKVTTQLPVTLSNLAGRHGGEVALIYEGETLTFAQLEDRSARLAGGLAESGVEPGDKVAVWLPTTFTWVELEFALARLGAVAVAINTRFLAHEVQDILARSEAKMLVLWPGFKDIDFLSIVADLDAEQIPELETLVLIESNQSALGETFRAGMRTVVYEDLLDHRRMEENLGQPNAPCIAFTSSGTTSAPKLILHAQRGVSMHSQAVAEAFSYRDPDCVVLGMLPFCGVFGFNTVMGTLAAGRPTVLMPVFDAADAVRLIETHKVTHTNGTDEMLRRILSAASPASRISSLREAGFASFSGDPKQLVAEGDGLGKTFYNVYGSSEVQALMAHQPAGADAERRALGGGVPVSQEIHVRVRDRETGELLPSGEPGELEICGPNVMVGYINNPKAEKEDFTDDGYVRTNDLGYLTEDGFVYLTRLGDTLRLSGFLVSPREIEAYLEGLPGIAAAQVVGVSTEGGTRPVAFVIKKEGCELDESGIIDRCQEGMAKFKVPKRVIALHDFPKVDSPNGPKIQRTKLRELAAKSLEEEIKE
jgi:fatty-acyl-CoA synthase